MFTSDDETLKCNHVDFLFFLNQLAQASLLNLLLDKLTVAFSQLAASVSILRMQFQIIARSSRLLLIFGV